MSAASASRAVRGAPRFQRSRMVRITDVLRKVSLTTVRSGIQARSRWPAGGRRAGRSVKSICPAGAGRVGRDGGGRRDVVVGAAVLVEDDHEQGVEAVRAGRRTTRSGSRRRSGPAGPRRRSATTADRRQTGHQHAVSAGCMSLWPWPMICGSMKEYVGSSPLSASSKNWSVEKKFVAKRSLQPRGVDDPGQRSMRAAGRSRRARSGRRVEPVEQRLGRVVHREVAVRGVDHAARAVAAWKNERLVNVCDGTSRTSGRTSRSHAPAPRAPASAPGV